MPDDDAQRLAKKFWSNLNNHLTNDNYDRLFDSVWGDQYLGPKTKHHQVIVTETKFHAAPTTNKVGNFHVLNSTGEIDEYGTKKIHSYLYVPEYRLTGKVELKSAETKKINSTTFTAVGKHHYILAGVTIDYNGNAWFNGFSEAASYSVPGYKGEITWTVSLKDSVHGERENIEWFMSRLYLPSRRNSKFHGLLQLWTQQMLNVRKI
jgi:hypothetical protein